MNTITRIVMIWATIMHACMAGEFLNYTYGGRANLLYVPTASGTRPLPVFVMLHGCLQNPTDFATGTNMNSYAETNEFFVVYPEQPATANVINCWNWFLPENQVRGSGEPALIVSIVQSLAANYSIDNASIFAGGLSAGAAMSDILGVTYPDVFSGVTVASGLEYPHLNSHA